MFEIFFAFSLLASAITTNKILLYALKPELLVGIRMVIAGFLLVIVTYIIGSKRMPWKTVRLFFPALFVISLFTTYFPSNLKAYALANMPSSKMAFFGAFDPFVAALYSHLWNRERLVWQQWAGILLGFLGMLVLVGATASFHNAAGFWIFSLPELAALWAIIVSRLGWIQAQGILKREYFTPIELNGILMLLGGAFSLITAFVRDQMQVSSLSSIDLPILTHGPLSFLSADNQLFFFLTYTIVVGNMIGYTVYAHTLKTYSATFIALAGFSIPLLVHLFGWIFLRESLSLAFFLSCAITFTGLAVFFYHEKKKVKL